MITRNNPCWVKVIVMKAGFANPAIGFSRRPTTRRWIYDLYSSINSVSTTKSTKNQSLMHIGRRSLKGFSVLKFVLCFLSTILITVSSTIDPCQSSSSKTTLLSNTCMKSSAEQSEYQGLASAAANKRKSLVPNLISFNIYQRLVHNIFLCHHNLLHMFHTFHPRIHLYTLLHLYH